MIRSKHNIKKIVSAASKHRHVAGEINPIIDNLNRGHGVDSDTVIWKRLGDGRIQPWFASDARRKLNGE